MANLMTIHCAIFIVSMAHPLKAGIFSSKLSTSTPSPQLSNSLMNSINYLDSIIDVKKRNDRIDITNTEELFEDLASSADAIHEEIANKDLDIFPFQSDLERKEMAECEKIFLDWRTLGNRLWTSYTRCRLNGLSVAKKYTEIMHETENVFGDLKMYREKLERCIRVKEFSSDLKFRNCDKALKGVQSIIESTRPHFNKYLVASSQLEQLRREINSGERCIDAVDEQNFYERAKTIVSEAKNCLRKRNTRINVA